MYSPKAEELVERQYERMKSEVLRRAIKVQSEILQASGGFLRQHGFVEILPVIMSPVTDPLRHATGRAEVEHYGHRYQLTRSMIFHKQIALLTHDRIFAFSPNIRLEPVELADTGRHLVEFTQLDLEMRGATREEVMDLVIFHAHREDRADRRFPRSRIAVAARLFVREVRRPGEASREVGKAEVARQPPDEESFESKARPRQRGEDGVVAAVE